MTISTVLRERAGSRWLAWATSVAAIILSVLPGAGSMVHSQLPAYDGSLAVLTATLVALIWYTQFTFDTLAHYRTRDEQERIRARAVLATGVLSELEWLEGRLEQVRLHGPYSDFDPFEHPVLEEILSRADIFSLTTASRLARFHALFRDVRSGVNAWRVNNSMFGEKGSADYFQARKQYKFVNQAKAHFALEALPALVASLREEGGQLPMRDGTVPIENMTLPELGASAFGPRRGETVGTEVAEQPG